MQLPDEYIWVTSGEKVIHDIAGVENIRLARSQSGIKMAVSIAQLVYASITLYRTRGTQINRYGYAAFGLSVFPYEFMSLFNFFCVGLVGEYPCIYAIRTTMMQEAEERGGKFNGAIGFPRKLDENDHPGTSTRLEGYDVTLMSMDGEKLVVKVGEHRKEFQLQAGGSGAYKFHLPSAIDQQENETSGLGGLAVILTVLLALILPHIVIFLFSGFKKNESTVAQRAWMMAWVCVNQICLFLGVGLVISPKASQTILVMAVLFGAPAIGGYIQVGMMLKESGTCAVVPS